MRKILSVFVAILIIFCPVFVSACGGASDANSDGDQNQTDDPTGNDDDDSGDETPDPKNDEPPKYNDPDPAKGNLDLPNDNPDPTEPDNPDEPDDPDEPDNPDDPDDPDDPKPCEICGQTDCTANHVKCDIGSCENWDCDWTTAHAHLQNSDGERFKPGTLEISVEHCEINFIFFYQTLCLVIPGMDNPVELNAGNILTNVRFTNQAILSEKGLVGYSVFNSFLWTGVGNYLKTYDIADLSFEMMIWANGYVEGTNPTVTYTVVFFST